MTCNDCGYEYSLTPEECAEFEEFKRTVTNMTDAQAVRWVALAAVVELCLVCRFAEYIEKRARAYLSVWWV